jgi:endonuclease III
VALNRILRVSLGFMTEFKNTSIYLKLVSLIISILASKITSMNYNFDKVFLKFSQNYKVIPLEVFKKNPYKTLVSTVLSSRTKDETTLVASRRLFKKASSIKKLSQLELLEIRNLIYPVGFYKTKSKNLKLLAGTVLLSYKGQIPKTFEELVKLPGVGRKTANLVLNRAFNIPAIAVDTHVHRITNMLGWVKSKTPEQTEKELVKIVPEKYWSDMNRLFVSIGRQYTTSKRLEEFLRNEVLI